MDTKKKQGGGREGHEDKRTGELIARAYLGGYVRVQCSFSISFFFLWNITVPRKKVITSRFPWDELKTPFLRKIEREREKERDVIRSCIFLSLAGFPFFLVFLPLSLLRPPHRLAWFLGRVNEARYFSFSRSHSSLSLSSFLATTNPRWVFSRSSSAKDELHTSYAFESGGAVAGAGSNPK